MTIPAPEITALVMAKGSNLLVQWRGQFINFGNVRMAEDGSFYFISGFHDGLYSPVMTLGEANFKDSKFYMGGPESLEQSPKDTHFSLHPDGQVMHFKAGHKGAVISERKFNWFPVTKAFNLLRLYSPPLAECLPTEKRSGLHMLVPDTYEDSLELVIDVFPADTVEHNPHLASLWINWGHSPHYKIRVTLNYTNQRVPALLFWPEDDLLKL